MQSLVLCKIYGWWTLVWEGYLRAFPSRTEGYCRIDYRSPRTPFLPLLFQRRFVPLGTLMLVQSWPTSLEDISRSDGYEVFKVHCAVGFWGAL